MEMEESKEMKTKIFTTVAIVGFLSTSANAETVTEDILTVQDWTYSYGPLFKAILQAAHFV